MGLWVAGTRNFPVAGPGSSGTGCSIGYLYSDRIVSRYPFFFLGLGFGFVFVRISQTQRERDLCFLQGWLKALGFVFVRISQKHKEGERERFVFSSEVALPRSWSKAKKIKAPIL